MICLWEDAAAAAAADDDDRTDGDDQGNDDDDEWRRTRGRTADRASACMCRAARQAPEERTSFLARLLIGLIFWQRDKV